MVQPKDIVSSIKKILPDASVIVQDLGGGDHFEVKVVSDKFIGLSLVQQHQLVYGALKDELKTESIHALALNTSTPS